MVQLPEFEVSFLVVIWFRSEFYVTPLAVGIRRISLRRYVSVHVAVLSDLMLSRRRAQNRLKERPMPSGNLEDLAVSVYQIQLWLTPFHVIPHLSMGCIELSKWRQQQLSYASLPRARVIQCTHCSFEARKNEKHEGLRPKR